MPPESPTCHFPSLFPPPSQEAHDSVLWMGQESNGPFWQHSVQLGKPGAHSYGLTFLAEEIMSEKFSLGSELCMPPWGRGDMSKVKRFLLPSPMHLNLYFFLHQHSGISPLDSGTPIKVLLPTGDYLRLFFRDSWTAAERGWSQFIGHCRVHSQDRGLSASYLMHRWMTFLPGPLEYGAGSHSPQKGIFVHG